MAVSTYEVLGPKAPTPCGEAEATAFAQAIMQPGTTLSVLPYKPAPLDVHEVRIRVTHAGMCHSDVFNATQRWFDFIGLPLVPGHEIVGIVTDLGSAVSDFAVGDRVAFGTVRDCCSGATCRMCSTAHENYCPKATFTYNPHLGGYSTSFQGRDFFFTKVPDNIPSEVAAPLMCAGITVYNPLAKHVRPGMKVGIQGIGGLGHLALQFANKMGAEVTAISTSASKEALARSLGAHHFLVSTDEAQVKAEAGTFDFILLTGTSYNADMFIGLLRPLATVAIVGAPDRGEEFKVNIFPFLIAGKTITSSCVGSMKETREMLHFCSVHNVRPKVEVFPFAEAQTAMNMLAHCKPRGPEFRCVLETESFLRAKGKI
jgi:D-arabinose 1-dehydrogenase-like Zn-dependent alcohol dehydrogenase